MRRPLPDSATAPFERLRRPLGTARRPFERRRDALLAEVSEHHRQASLPCSRQDCRNQKDQLLGDTSELKESLHAMEDRLRVVGQDLADARLNQSVLEQSNDALERTILYFKQERLAVEQSASWRATRRVARLASSIAPPASGRRQTMKRIERLLEITHREGIRVIPRRLWSKAKCGLTDITRLGFGQQTPWVPDGRPVFVLVHRRGGGGTDRHLREVTTGLRTAGVRPVMIAPGPEYADLGGAGDGRTAILDVPGSLNTRIDDGLARSADASTCSDSQHDEATRDAARTAGSARCDLRLDPARLLPDLPSRAP